MAEASAARDKLPPTGVAAAAREGLARRTGSRSLEVPPLVEFGDAFGAAAASPPPFADRRRLSPRTATPPPRRRSSGRRDGAFSLLFRPSSAAPPMQRLRRHAGPPAPDGRGRAAGFRSARSRRRRQRRRRALAAGVSVSAPASPRRWGWRLPPRSGPRRLGRPVAADRAAIPARAETAGGQLPRRRPRRRSAWCRKPNAPGPATRRRSCRWRSSTPRATAWRRTTPPPRNGFAPPPSAG